MCPDLDTLLNFGPKQCLTGSLRQISSEMAPKERLACQKMIDLNSVTKGYA
jgi:hypothetical protein